MTNLSLDNNYWNERYLTKETGWDIGYPSPSFIEYFKNIDKSSKLLIPGCGNSYEGEALYAMGFKNITLLDFAITSKENFINRVPNFPSEQYLIGDFFELNEQYDFILEQTFFCAINPNLREKYALKMKDLLAPNGKLVGLLFDAPLNTDHPPFGGSTNEYNELFSKHFHDVSIAPCENSIIPRAGKEVWIEIS